jgi:hypothetical protein
MPGVEQTKVEVPDIQPFGLSITVMDRSRKPIGAVDFEIEAEGGAAEKRATDNSGKLKVAKSKKVKVTLLGNVDV